MRQTLAPNLIMTADPDFRDLALDELHAVDSAAALLGEPAPGVLLIVAQASFFDVAELWHAMPPIFVRHVCPVLGSVRLWGGESDLDDLSGWISASLLDLFDPRLPFSVQSRILADLPYKPFDVNSRLAAVVSDVVGCPLDVRAPQQILSVVCADALVERQQGTWAFLGVSLASQNLSDWAGGVHRFAREVDQISRSEFKLLEALHVFGVSLPARGRALDLGAAPGGWTRVLRQHQQYVTAVDPGDLDSRLAADRSVRHLRMTAQAYLASDPDHFDLLVNDMRMDALESARLMVLYAEYLLPDGIALMTLKLPTHNKRDRVDRALSILGRAYEVIGTRQLFHNRSEITVCMRIKRSHSA